MERRVKLWFVHGFLGLPSDWYGLEVPETQSEYINLWQDFAQAQPKGLDDWATSWLERNRADLTDKEDHYLVGYSLGGRWALHVLTQAPGSFKGAACISTHFGLPLEQRAERLTQDLAWAQKFKLEPWHDLLAQWNAQAVLATSSAFERQEIDFNRDILAGVMMAGSLGRQKDLRPQLKELSIPLLCMGGEKDRKFASMAGEWASVAEVAILANAGHRVPWDVPHQFAQRLGKFVLGSAPQKARKEFNL